MLDLSNNNGTGHDFARAFQSGQRRLYLKRCQGVHFTDQTYPTLRARARAAGFLVGAYAFLEPLAASPVAAADYFAGLLAFPLKHGHDLRPCLDVEWGRPSAAVGRWVAEVAHLIGQRAGASPVVYGSGWYLEACSFPTAPGPLWLAAYGRDDGREYSVGRLPRPWTARGYAAHQFTDRAKVAGIVGRCDLSHVLLPDAIDAPAR